MSTIKVNSIKNTSTDDGGIAIDNSGHVQIDGQQLPTAGPLSHRNLVINGAAEVNQRGTISSGVNYGGPDRFIGFINATSYVCERSQQIDAPANTGLQKCFQLKTTTARTGTTADQYVALGQILEFQNIYNAIWGGHSHVTVSFWVKSSITGTFAFNMNPYNTDSGLSGNRVLYHATYTISSANTWEKKTITIPLAGLTDNHSVLATTESDQIGRGLELTWVLGISSGGNRTSASTGWSTTEGRNAVSSFSSNTGFLSTVNATFKLTGVQLEVGEKATPFEHRSYGDELARCQRYFQHSFTGAPGTGNTSNLGVAFAGGGTTGNTTTFIGGAYIQLSPTMRATPTVTIFDLASPRNTGKLHRHTYGSAGSNNNTAVVTDTNTKSFVVRSDSGSSASGIIFHWQTEAEL